MKFFSLLLISFSLVIAGCDELELDLGDETPAEQECPDGKCPLQQHQPHQRPPAPQNTRDPGMNLPTDLRQSNWGGGSCVYASAASNLTWLGQYSKANYIRRNCIGAASIQDLARVLDKIGVRYAYTAGKNGVEFLEHASATRRGAVIFFYHNHAVSFCYFLRTQQGEYAVILDNNRTGKYKYVPKQEFLSRWAGYGSVALTMLYTPPPPIMYVKQPRV